MDASLSNRDHLANRCFSRVSFLQGDLNVGLKERLELGRWLGGKESSLCKREDLSSIPKQPQKCWAWLPTPVILALRRGVQRQENDSGLLPAHIAEKQQGSV